MKLRSIIIFGSLLLCTTAMNRFLGPYIEPGDPEPAASLFRLMSFEKDPDNFEVNFNKEDEQIEIVLNRKVNASLMVRIMDERRSSLFFSTIDFKKGRATLETPDLEGCKSLYVIITNGDWELNQDIPNPYLEE